MSVILGIVLTLLAQITLPKATYRNRGPVLLPDPVVTPGAETDMSKEEICATKWGQDVRHVTTEMKDAVCEAYGLKKHCYGRDTYEIDHLISRELGGIDDIHNLWPQPYSQHPGAHEKDTVENWLHKQVCTGKMDLKDAQRQIAHDWYQIYLEMEAKR